MGFLRETWLLFRANVRTTLRNPVWTIFGLFNPICYLLLYAPLYANLNGSSDAAAYNGFVPGLVVMTSLFTTAFAGFGVIEHLRSGYLERLRVTPVHRLSLPLGYILRDVVIVVIQSSLLLAMATLMGMRADGLGLVLLLGLLVLIGLLMTSCSYALALLFKDENALSSTVNFVSLPLLLLSGVLLPLTFAPQLMRTIASINPFSHAVEAARALVSGHLTDSAVPLGFVLLAVLAVLGLVWVTRSFRQATS
jgi:ABC-2 type transport system permease protein